MIRESVAHTARGGHRANPQPFGTPFAVNVSVSPIAKVFALAAAVALAGCATSSTNGSRLTPPTRICRGAHPDAPCRTAAEVETLLARPDLEIVAVGNTPAGIQGARVLTLRAPGPHPVVFRAKWRAHSTNTSRNSPRLELAAYGIQQLFLEPAEYVVPPSAPHCFPIEPYRASVDPKAHPTFGAAPCVYGILSYWLEDVQSLADAATAGWFHGQDRHAFDPALFEKNRSYRDSVADMNLLTYLIGDGDSHPANFVITRDRETPFVYSVDNSMWIELHKNRKLKPQWDWSKLKVPALPRAAVDRLRAADERLAAFPPLAVLHVVRGQLVVMSPSPIVRVESGTTWFGHRLAVGLTRDELLGVRRRLAALLARIDAGEIRVY